MAKEKRFVEDRNTNLDKKNICFVIMPMGGWFDEYYEAIFCPAIKAVKLMPCRADDLYRPSAIVHDIWSYTKAAKLILADLTEKNPNVFYELGLAHAIGKPAILLAQSMEDVPFDLRALRVIEYDKNAPNWGDELKEKIKISIKQVLSSPLAAVLPTFIEVKKSLKKSSITPHEKEIIEIKQELDLLREEVQKRREVEVVRPRIHSPQEAEARLEHYFRIGMEPDLIFNRLRRMGVPAEWLAKN